MAVNGYGDVIPIRVNVKKAGIVLAGLISAATAGFGGSYIKDNMAPSNIGYVLNRVEEINKLGTQLGQANQEHLRILSDKVEHLDNNGSRAVLAQIAECRGRIQALETFRTELNDRLKNIENLLQQVLLKVSR